MSRVVFLLSAACDAVALHLAQQVFGIVGPVQCHVAPGQPCACHGRDVGLRAVEAQGVVVGGCGLEELALAELCVGHHEPGVVHVGVELLAGQEGFLLLGAPVVALYDGALLDAVHLDGLLALRDGGLEVALAHAGCRLVGADVHGQHLVEVVLVPFALCLFAFAEGHLPVVERVVVGGQGVIGAHGRRVLLRGAGCEEQQTNEQTGVARQGRHRALPQ